MADSAEHQSHHLDAMQRDGTIGRDLDIAEWMARSTPNGEYRGNRTCFSIVTAAGAMTVGPQEWVVRGPTVDFYPSNHHPALEPEVGLPAVPRYRQRSNRSEGR